MRLSKVFSYFILYFTFAFLLHSGKAAIKSGPYRSTILKTEKCEKPSKPYEAVPTATFYAELYNTSKKQNLIRGAVTILKDNKNAKMRFKGYYKENGKWELSYLFDKVGCNGVVLHVLTAILGIDYDKETCSAAKGTYSFENVDFNELDHKWTSDREYGHLKWVMEAYSKAGVVVCWETECLVEPI